MDMCTYRRFYRPEGRRCRPYRRPLLRADTRRTSSLHEGGSGAVTDGLCALPQGNEMAWSEIYAIPTGTQRGRRKSWRSRCENPPVFENRAVFLSNLTRLPMTDIWLMFPNFFKKPTLVREPITRRLFIFEEHWINLTLCDQNSSRKVEPNGEVTS